MTTSEPTTGEIVMALRGCHSRKMTCAECRYNTGDSAKCLDIMQQEVADRLESQEQKIAALTARAEQAEKERDAAIEHVHDAIFGTNHSCFYCTMENCDGCTNSTVKEHFKYRGLAPQMYLFRNEGDTK